MQLDSCGRRARAGVCVRARMLTWRPGARACRRVVRDGDAVGKRRRRSARVGDRRIVEASPGVLHVCLEVKLVGVTVPAGTRCPLAALPCCRAR